MLQTLPYVSGDWKFFNLNVNRKIHLTFIAWRNFVEGVEH